jgi:LysR family hca operon transcriptional activator
MLLDGLSDGHELTWMPEALKILRDELPNIDVMIIESILASACGWPIEGRIDAAFLRREGGVPELAISPWECP